MSENTESEYYNTTYVLYENNTEEATNTEVDNTTKTNHTREELPEEVAAQPRRTKKKEDQLSLYDEDLYSLPTGAKIADISKNQLEMDQLCANKKEKGSKSCIGIVGAVIGCLATIAIVATCYIVLQKDSKGKMSKCWICNVKYHKYFDYSLY